MFFTSTTVDDNRVGLLFIYFVVELLEGTIHNIVLNRIYIHNPQ